MNWNYIKKNNYFFGALLGLIVPPIFYIILLLLNTLALKAGIWKGFNPPENIFLLSVSGNFLLFRPYFIRFRADKTGRGILFVTIVLILSFFYLYFRQT